MARPGGHCKFSNSREHFPDGSVERGMKRIFCLLIVLVTCVNSARAIGLILVHDEDFWRRRPPGIPSQPVPPRPPRMTLDTVLTRADVRIKDQWATATIEQEFYNPHTQRLEGTFLFPVPKGAQIDKFTMEINGKPVDAELLAADKARGIYEDIVRRMQDPALLEYAGRDLFKVRVFPIEPHSRKRVTLTYSQLLKSENGVAAFALPLNTSRFAARPVKNLALKLELETRHPLKSIYSPSHKVEVKRNGSRHATIGYQAAETLPDEDFQIYFAQERDELGLHLLTHRTGSDDGYFLLLASPGAEEKPGRTLPKDVMFVLDTSGSMAGAKLAQARKALAFCVENLNDQDRFDVLRFATEVEPLFGKLTAAGAESRARAQSFIKHLKPLGGTAIDDALTRALALRPEKADRPYLVIFLTDGLPTVGNTREDDIVANVTRNSGGNTRVFCFGIGHDVNAHMLDKMAEVTRAASQYVLPEEDIEVKVSAFFSKIKEPMLASPKIEFPESVRVTRLYPSPLPDVFKGDQIVLAGRYSGDGSGTIRITGMVNGEPRTFQYDGKFPGASDAHEFIPRLWATRRVGYLLDEIRLRGENRELKDEVVELARQYSIVTPYTAYLITEDESRRGVTLRRRTVQLSDGVQLAEAKAEYDSFMKEKSGSKAISGARSYQQLKAADAPSLAIAAGTADALRYATPPPTTEPLSRAQTSSRPAVIAGKPVSLESAARQFSQQSRFVGGKTFYQNEAQWVDAEVQKLSSSSKVRVQFSSKDYFELQRKHPKAQNWLALGSNVQFVLDGTLYEVFE